MIPSEDSAAAAILRFVSICSGCAASLLSHGCDGVSQRSVSTWFGVRHGAHRSHRSHVIFIVFSRKVFSNISRDDSYLATLRRDDRLSVVSHVHVLLFASGDSQRLLDRHAVSLGILQLLLVRFESLISEFLSLFSFSTLLIGSSLLFGLLFGFSSRLVQDRLLLSLLFLCGFSRSESFSCLSLGILLSLHGFLGFFLELSVLLCLLHQRRCFLSGHLRLLLFFLLFLLSQHSLFLSADLLFRCFFLLLGSFCCFELSDPRNFLLALHSLLGHQSLHLFGLSFFLNRSFEQSCLLSLLL